MENVWVVIPAYNECKNIRRVIQRTKKVVDNVVVVDDGSSDRTCDEVRPAGIHTLCHIVNLGKGSALKTGCDYALDQGAGVMVAMDADGQHDPNDIPRFVKALEGRDIVFGYRKLDKSMPGVLKFGNWFINNATRLLYGIRLRDTQSGYRAFTADAYRKIRWDAQDYSMESEMIANAGKAGLEYKEIPIRTVYSDRYKGTTVLDGMKIVLKLIWWRVTRW